MAHKKKISKQPKKSSKKKAKSTLGGFFALNVSLRVIKSLLLGFIVVLFLGGLLVVGIGAGYFAHLVEGTPTPTKTEIKQEVGDIAEPSKLLYADDQELATIQSDPIREKVDSDEISTWVKKALVATEDENFYEHRGVVPKAVVRALLGELVGFGAGSGGSTLTQQVVKQQVLTNETSFKRKANEIVLAFDLEKYLSKDEILTAYLNVSPFGRNNKGQNIAGVEEAAIGIFGVHAKDLSLPQSAFIAGLPQSPIVYSPYTNTGDLKQDYSIGMARKDDVLFNMYRQQMISKKEYDEAKKYDLSKDFQAREDIEVQQHGFLYYTVYNEAISIVAKQQAEEDGVSDSEYNKDDVRSRYVEQAKVKMQNQGLVVKSTIDKNIYDAMQLGVAEYGQYLDDGSGATIEPGTVMMDNQTGRIYGFIGSRDYNTNQNNHAFDTVRQAGSSIKPVLVYGPAIDQGLLGSATRIADFPMKYQRGEHAGKELENAENKGSKTFQTAREALVESTNITAYHVYQDMLAKKGSEQFAYDNYLKKMNYPTSNTWGVESAPLGTTGISTLTEINGFQTLANGGVYQQGYMIESITDSTGKEIYKHKNAPVQVFSKATASIMNDMMRSVINEQHTTPFKSILSGVNYSLSTADWVGKTGTTDNYADNWLIVSTPSITLGTWTGRDDNKPMNDGAGNRTATYMAYLAGRIYQVNPSVFAENEEFELSDDVKQIKVSDFTGLKSGKVSHNGTNYQVPSGETTSLWAKDGPAENTYEFGIGGDEDDYKTYWNTRNKVSAKNKNTETDEDD
ncbi:transglycosylase domain-containing protein [Enterococcus xiangfangensis]|uniref:Transglycosylase domain-containing protein n=1 Tax=Enterococcus xiangfangensis TaxID=1296537 RepID=A0ABU3FB08_9ENTE|nr:transglycosylase domain-containing protein [Enterococcus xiangfangensis]MBM7712605.1 penicillin-binding protein [Enterococcus xiangfangensis]MDT2759685.1 transglycosylase domain-containing protein [Enterococcus xiangfangensis]NBK08674.1 penicillin-binding protein [Enterococcus asini]